MFHADLAGALAAGLASGAHCMGMCGPAVALASQLGGARRGTAAFLLGKTGSYLLLGSLLGTGGAMLLRISPLAPTVVRLLAGLVFTWIGAELLAPNIIPKPGLPGLNLGSLVSQGLRRAGGTAGALALGMLAGLAPCGLSWGMAAWAAGTGSASHGAALMVAFAVGTAPALGLAAYLARTTSLSGPGMRRLAGIVWLVLGLALLVQAGSWLWAASVPPCCRVPSGTPASPA